MTEKRVFWGRGKHEPMLGVNMEWEGTGQLEIPLWNEKDTKEKRHCEPTDFLMKGKSEGAQWMLKGKNR